MNLGGCRKLDHGPETGVWYRAVQLAHLTTPIDTAHTRATPSRFSAGPNANPPFEILYLSESLQVAQFEIGALAGDPLVVGGILNAPGSFAAVQVKLVLQQVADLTVVSQQELIETTAQELTGDWRGYQHRASSRLPIQEPRAVSFSGSGIGWEGEAPAEPLHSPQPKAGSDGGLALPAKMKQPCPGAHRDGADAGSR